MANDTIRPIRRWFSSSWPSFSDHPDHGQARLPSFLPLRRLGGTGPKQEFRVAPVAAVLVYTKLGAKRAWLVAVAAGAAAAFG